MRKIRPALALSAALAVLTCLPASAAPQWKWRDASGSVQYSDRPPPAGTPDKDILIRPSRSLRPAAAPVAPASASAPGSGAVGNAAAAPRPALKASDPELEARRKQAEAEKEAERKAEEARQAQARAQDCERARGYQKALADGHRISRTNAQGEREILDDAQRAQELARTNENIAAACR